jgi:hypothetical protein
MFYKYYNLILSNSNLHYRVMCKSRTRRAKVINSITQYRGKALLDGAS